MADIDLATLLPTVNRDELNDSYMANLFNRHLSKDASSILIGYVGDKAEGDTSIYLPQENIDRSHNALQPMFKVLHGATEYVFNYNDLIQKLALMDIDPKRIADFMKDKTFNLMFQSIWINSSTSRNITGIQMVCCHLIGTKTWCQNTM